MTPDNDSLSLKELLAAVSAGDSGAKEELRRRYGSDLTQFTECVLYRKGCSLQEHCEEVYRSAFFKMFEKVEQLKDPDKLARWATRILMREAVGHVRGPKGCIQQQKKTTPYEEQGKLTPAQIYSSDVSIISALLTKEIFEVHAKKIHPKLPEIMRLHFIEGLTFKETAPLVDESDDNVRTICSRGVRELLIILREGDDGTVEHLKLWH